MTATDKQFDIHVTLQLSVQDLTDLLITAIEGGSNYWCPKIRLNAIGFPNEVVTRRLEGEVYNEFICRNVAAGGTLTFFEQDEYALFSTREALIPHTMSRDKLLNGIQQVLTKYPHILKIDSTEFPLDNVDAESADAIVQMALFGELRYG